MGTFILAAAVLISLAAGTAAAAPEPTPKSPAYLVLTNTVREGNPASPLHAAKSVMADRKINARLQQAGFQEAVADLTPALTLDYLEQFNLVVCLGPVGDGSKESTPGPLAGLREQIEKRLLQYVQDGGGLLVLRSPGYQFGTDITALSRWLKPCGIEVLSEQVVDEDSAHTLRQGGNRLHWTDNLTPHPITEGVKGVFYPDTFSVYAAAGYTDFTSPVRVEDAWTVLLRGRKSAKSLATQKGKDKGAPQPGRYGAAPPLLAVREYGLGRIAVWPIAATCIWQDSYHMFWGNGVLMEGKIGGAPGNAARLLDNLFAYLAEPSRGRFGGYMPPKKEEPKESGFQVIDWDKQQVAGAFMPQCHLGLIGARSRLSCGQGEPEAFIQAAKAAGYQFLAFTEELAELTPETFAQLQELCAKHSEATFKAYAGYSYLDESGNAWATFGPTVKWPEPAWLSEKKPGAIRTNNTLSRSCDWPPVILLKAGRNPEPPWLQGNYKVFSVYTYENGTLVDDALDLYLRIQKDRFTLAPVAVHLVDSPAAVARARTTGYQTYVRWFDEEAVQPLSGHYCKYKGRYIWYRSSFVSEGPILEDARIVNMGTTDLALPGCDRIRVHVRASAPAGLRDVTLLDADAPRPWRRFLPGGARDFEQTIDAFHDHEYMLILTATDSAGKKAVGWVCWTNVQENMFPRCSDNFNTMPRGKWFILPQALQNPRGFECYSAVRNFTYFGLASLNSVDTTRHAVEYYPFHVSRFASVIDCVLERHYPPDASANPDMTDKPQCAVLNADFAGRARHTLFAGWNDGPMVELVEGEFTAKRDVALKGAAVGRANGLSGDRLVLYATPANGSAYSAVLSPRTPSFSTPLPLYGVGALFPQPFYGALGFIALQDGLKVNAHSAGGYAYIGLALTDGTRTLKAGQQLTYRYLAVISQLDAPTDNRFVTEVRDSLGLGTPPAYRVTPSVGTVADTCFTLTLQAHEYAFAGRVSEAKLPLPLPTRILGLQPSWDAVIWYKGTVTRVVPEFTSNELGELTVERHRRQETNALIHIPVLADGTGLLQIDTDVGEKDVFIGNPLVCDQPDVVLTLVDARSGRAAFVAHNPTDVPLTCQVTAAAGFTLLGTFTKPVYVPGGSSVRVPLP